VARLTADNVVFLMRLKGAEHELSVVKADNNTLRAAAEKTEGVFFDRYAVEDVYTGGGTTLAAVGDRLSEAVQLCLATQARVGRGGGWGCDRSARSEVERTVQQALSRAEELEERLAHVTVDREEEEVAWKRRMAATEQRAVAAEQRLAELQDSLLALRTQRDDAVSAADGAVEHRRRAEREREDMTHEVRVLKNTVTDMHKQALQHQVS
jgi:hypothetical protein